MNENLDCLFLVTSSSKKSYQSLSKTYSAIEPPTWALLLAQSMRADGNQVGILDANAQNLNEREIYDKINHLKPRLICFVVYGQNVNAGTTNMSGAVHISNYLKSEGIKQKICFVGSHVQAWPKESLESESSIDFVFTNEGVYALRNILKLKHFNSKDLENIKGIAYRNEEGKVIINSSEKVVPTNRMDIDLPGYAWDLLPFDKKPLDLYRAPMWHAEYDFQKRSLLSRAKGLIVPNRWDEPCGQVIIEALACGTPIIGTNKGSLKEMIIGNKTGILCNSYGELIDATRNIKFLSNKECRKDACNRFSLEKYTNDTEKIYQNILNKYWSISLKIF